MLINLTDGHIDAFDFKLTSDRLSLKSHPQLVSDDYYLNIGDDN
jgi:hypothetical protein